MANGGIAIAATGGGDNGGMETRVTRLQSAMEHIQSDISDIRTHVRDIRAEVRAQFYWIVAGFAAMLAVMAKGFGWL